jgi:uncharacterized protein (DUF2141 family)
MINLFFCLMSVINFSENDPQKDICKVTITVEGLRNDKGTVMIGIFNKADGFPENYKSVYIQQVIPTTTMKKTSAVFELPADSNYAVAVIHDENNNGKLDTNFLGMPIEGYGFSNNKSAIFGAPSFKDCSFSLKNKTSESIKISLKYWL